jgi:hypothetical protein
MRPNTGRISAMFLMVSKFPRFRNGQQPKLREMNYVSGVILRDVGGWIG